MSLSSRGVFQLPPRRGVAPIAVASTRLEKRMATSEAARTALDMPVPSSTRRPDHEFAAATGQSVASGI